MRSSPHAPGMHTAEPAAPGFHRSIMEQPGEGVKTKSLGAPEIEALTKGLTVHNLICLGITIFQIPK